MRRALTLSSTVTRSSFSSASPNFAASSISAAVLRSDGFSSNRLRTKSSSTNRCSTDFDGRSADAFRPASASRCRFRRVLSQATRLLTPTASSTNSPEDRDGVRRRVMWLQLDRTCQNSVGDETEGPHVRRGTRSSVSRVAFGRLQSLRGGVGGRAPDVHRNGIADCRSRLEVDELPAEVCCEPDDMGRIQTAVHHVTTMHVAERPQDLPPHGYGVWDSGSVNGLTECRTSCCSTGDSGRFSSLPFRVRPPASKTRQGGRPSGLGKTSISLHRTRHQPEVTSAGGRTCRPHRCP